MTRKVLSPVTLATIIVIFYTTMPIVSVFVSTYITTYAYMLLSVFLLGFILLSGGISRLNTMIYLIVPFIVYIGCTFFLRGDSLTLWGYQNMLFLLPVIIGYYFLYYRTESVKIFVWIIIVSVLITVITTIIGLIQFPFVARILATIAESDNPENIKYSWHNIGGYNFVYSVVLLYPILILARKLKKINLLVFLTSAILMFIVIVLSEYAIAMLLFLLSSFLYLAGRNISARQLLLTGILFFLALFFLWPVISNSLLWLADVLNSETLAERLTALASGLIGVENSESNRMELYEMSLRGFFSSPVFGRMTGIYTTSGGHSFILDALANYGIFGGLTVVFMYRNIYRFFFKPFEDNDNYGFVLWTFVQTIILSTINTGMWLNVLAFFAPTLFCFIYNFSSEESYENSLGS